MKTGPGRKEISHSGGIAGFLTRISRYPDQKVCVVVLCNVFPSRAKQEAHDVAAIAFGDEYRLPEARKAAKVAPKVLDSYVGRYEVRPGRVVTITGDGDRLLSQQSWYPPMAFLPASESEFFAKFDDARLTFVKDARGKVTHLVLQLARPEEAKRLEEPGEKPQK